MAETDEKTAMVAGGFIVLAFPIFMTLFTVWHGFVLQELWNWFAAPILKVRFSLGEAIGVMLLRSILMPTRLSKKGEETSPGSFWIAVLIAPALWLVFGWLAHTAWTS